MATDGRESARHGPKSEGGYNEAADTWLRIIVAIEVLQRGSAT
jgi:hypothetical protein